MRLLFQHRVCRSLSKLGSGRISSIKLMVLYNEMHTTFVFLKLVVLPACTLSLPLQDKKVKGSNFNRHVELNYDLHFVKIVIGFNLVVLFFCGKWATVII